MCNLQSRLDTYFNKDNHRTVLYFLVYDQDNEKQNDFKKCNVVTVSCKIDHLNSSGRFTGGKSSFITPLTKFNNKFF